MTDKITSVMMKMIPELEYKKLLDENTELKEKILNLYRNEEKFKNDILTNELTIIELRKENEMLKNKLKKLEEHVNEQDITINKLNQRLDDLEMKNQFNKLVVAIQDLNKKDECHYINEDDDEYMYNHKKIILLEKLNNMSQTIKTKFHKIYPNVVENIIKHIGDVKIDINNELFDEANEWWD